MSAGLSDVGRDCGNELNPGEDHPATIVIQLIN